MREKKIELLAPAGDTERLRMAVAYGADAVYLAGDQFGMRAFAGNFDEDQLAAAIDHLTRTSWPPPSTTATSMGWPFM